MRMKCLLIPFLCLLWFSADGAPLAVGDAVPIISAKDQFGKEFIFTNTIQHLLVATEMSSAKAANKALANQGGGYLEKHHAAYLMDIHTMPGVARWFAFPKMRRYPQRIVLVDSAVALAAFPSQPNCVTVLAITPAGRILKIDYWKPESEPLERCLR